MKSTVENLSPTRVRLTVEVPFEELKGDFDRAFKQLAQQVRLPGFRPGKAPAKLLEARVGRAAILEQVVNDALPNRYSEAVAANEIKPLGQPDIDITKLEDGEELHFTAEVDVRPEIDLPDLSTLNISVDAIEIDDADVEKELDSLRARFGTLTGVDRPVADGDFVSIDLTATVDGEDVPEATTEGLSHEVGSGQLIDGLDEALIGLNAGESKTFTTKLAAGEYAGKDADVTVTVGSVKERELPEVDDEFAQLASEFDTIDELKSNLREQVERFKRIQQAEKIRDTALETLLEQVEVPLPEKILEDHIGEIVHNAVHELDHDEDAFAEQLKEQGSSREEWDAETRSNAEKALRTQLLMDAVADDLGIQVGQQDLMERLALMSRQYGIEPQQLLGILQQNNQLPQVFADVRRGLTVAAVVEAATVTDSDGNVVDTSEFFGNASPETAAEDAAAVEEALSD
ncbi:trigger factor [Mycolicibacterium brumae]|uniref:Trigger factor n=1 Tax=Mycolicibacterium brumae TaxID=85968 RepID=A0A2G5PBS7_9MYCO|nr:trigger factor [Mycolicibacterium brumae]MCV7191475.1 trigger factor [Mycolicibacterium brumae]PIB75717.1 trigger factor [Mycolicibacterium brumae]RWA16187.1 trigger factor [Mycolicibacterium brumae DSM 44177]UWW09418.1 trigger factor [Mycolicibacterium brumae]